MQRRVGAQGIAGWSAVHLIGQGADRSLCKVENQPPVVHLFENIASLDLLQEVQMEQLAIATVAPFHQIRRPSFHSLVLLASHIALVMPIFAAWRRSLRVEALCILLSATISFGYHLCDENVFCPLGLSIVQWHGLDVWSTFFLICFVFGVSVLNLQQTKVKFATRAVYLAAVTTAVWYDRSSLLLFGGLLVSVAVMVAIRYIGAALAARVASTHWDKTKRCYVGTSFAQRNGGIHNLVRAICCFCASLLCFVTANTPIIGTATYSAEVHGAMKPMDVPDTSVYWLFHSAWHAGSAISIYFVLVFVTPLQL